MEVAARLTIPARSWRTHVPLAFSLFCFAMAAIGFSDNWLTDLGQPSNRDPKFLIHGGFALSWFALFVAQTALANRGNARLHIELGGYGVAAFIGMTASTAYLYLLHFVVERQAAPLSVMVGSQWLIGSLMIAHAFIVRRENREGHRQGMLIGTLLLLQPSLDRAIGKLFGDIGLAWLLTYAGLFLLFAIYLRWRSWRLALAFAVWLGGLLQFLLRVSG